VQVTCLVEVEGDVPELVEPVSKRGSLSAQKLRAHFRHTSREVATSSAASARGAKQHASIASKHRPSSTRVHLRSIAPCLCCRMCCRELHFPGLLHDQTSKYCQEQKSSAFSYISQQSVQGIDFMRGLTSAISLFLDSLLDITAYPKP
jgi:hypothetical protein